MPLSSERNKSWNLKKDARRQQKKEGGRIVHGAAAQDGLLLLGVSETRKIATIVMPTVPTDNVSGPKFLAKKQNKRFGCHQKGGSGIATEKPTLRS